MNIHFWLITIGSLTLESFSIFLFKDYKELHEDIEDATSLDELKMFSLDNREYCGRAIMGSVFSIWMTIISLCLLIFTEHTILFSGITLFFSYTFVYFFNHWRNSNGLGSLCIDKRLSIEYKEKSS